MSRRESIDGSKLVLAYRYIKAHYKQKAIKVKSENQYDLHVIGLNVYLILFTTCLLYCTCYLFWSNCLTFPLDILPPGRAPRSIDRIHSSSVKFQIIAWLVIQSSLEIKFRSGKTLLKLLHFNSFSLFFFLTTYSQLIYHQFSMIAPKPLILFLVTEIIAQTYVSFHAPFSHFSSLDTDFPHFVFRHSMKH